MKLRATCNCGCDNVVNVEMMEGLISETALSFAKMEMTATLKEKCWRGKVSIKEVKDLTMIEETKIYLKLKENLENAIESLNEFNIETEFGLIGIPNIRKNLIEDLNILRRVYTGKYFYDLDSIQNITEYNKDTFCQEERKKPKPELNFPL